LSFIMTHNMVRSTSETNAGGSLSQKMKRKKRDKSDGAVPNLNKQNSVTHLHLETTTKAELQKVFEGIRPKLNRLGVSLHLTDEEPNPEKLFKMQELLQLQQDGTGTLSPLTVDVLKTAANYLNKIINEQKNIGSAIKIQALARGWIIRKQMQSVKPYLGTLMNIKVIFCDLIKTERQYITDLKSVINTFLVPCRAKATTSEECHDLVAVFSNIETILGVHQTLLREILHIQEFRWPFFNGLGNLFMKHASEFQNYGDYAENCTTSRTMVVAITNKKHKFREVFENGGPAKLENLLLMPLQRVAKYGEVLESFLYHSTAIDSDEIELLSRAQAIMTNIKELVTHKLELADRYAVHQEIQRLVIDEKPVQLHNGTRFLVHRGNITTAASKKLHFFLFNDILLLTKAQGERFKLLHKIELVKSTMEASSEGLYELSFPTNEKLQFRVTEKSQENLERIQKQIFKHKKTGVIFGIPLEQVLKAEKRHLDDGGNGVPMLVEYIVEHLRKNALQAEGLLRVTGNFARIERLKRLLDNSSLKSFDSIRLVDLDVHDVAAVLRVYFRELPVPVIPFEFYEPLMNVQRNADLSIDDRVQAIKKIIVTLPPTNTALLKYLVRFLQEVEAYSHINKMTVSNLAIVFGPNIVRAKVETVQCALEMPLLQGIIQILIEHSKILWGINPPESVRTSRPLSTLFVGKDLQQLSQLPDDQDVPIGNAKKKAPPLPPERLSPLVKPDTPKARSSSMIQPRTGGSPGNSIRDRMRIFEPPPSPEISSPNSPQSPSLVRKSSNGNVVAATKGKLNLNLDVTRQEGNRRSTIGGPPSSPSPRTSGLTKSSSPRTKEKKEKKKKLKKLRDSVS